MTETAQPTDVEWDDFVRRAKGGTIFHLSWYLRCLSNQLDYVVVRDGSGRILSGVRRASAFGERPAHG